MNSSQINIVPFVPYVQGTNGTFSTNKHRYTLEKGSKKFHCPECNKKTFVRYLDIETNDYLPDQYGRCDRESKCFNHLNPYLDGYAKMIWEQEQNITGVSKVAFPKQRSTNKPKPQPEPEPIFFDFETFKQTLEPERYEKNIFIQNLLNKVQYPFEVDDITKVVQLYRLGTITEGYRAGANTFPFIDVNDKIRAIQVKEFDEFNSTKKNGTDYLHSIIEKYYTRNNKPLPEWLELYKKQDKKISCLFGEHLLNKYPNNPIALVEAPKTAIYGTLYFGLPNDSNDLIWLAVYNKSSFSFDKLKVLQGRYVYVFPDLSKDGNTFNEWETKAKEYENHLPGTRFIFSDLLEQLAPDSDKCEGKDIADYLIRQDWRLFRKRNIPKQLPQHNFEKVTGVTKVTRQQNILIPDESLTSKVEVFRNTQNEQSISWSNDIVELEKFFESIDLPTQPIMMNQCTTITDCSFFIESHFSIIKLTNKKSFILPYLHRLKELKIVLSEKLNQS